MKTLFFRLLTINSDPVVVQFKDKALSPLAHVLIILKISPNLLTLLGLITGLAASILIGRGFLQIAGACLFISLLLDGLDGLVARMLKKENLFGAFLDGVCDRYADLFILFGLVWYSLTQNNILHISLICIAIIGTSVTSYTTPHALSLSIVKSKKHIGVFGRVQRMLLLIMMLLFPSLLTIALWILAILSNATAIHRVYYYSSVFRST